jgi:hypothetical protein
MNDRTESRPSKSENGKDAHGETSPAFRKSGQANRQFNVPLQKKEIRKYAV